MQLLSGMDIGQIRSLARQMDDEAAEIRTVVQQMTSQLESASWSGTDRERFIAEWRSRHVTALLKVATGLEQASRQAREHARQQEAASRT